MTSEQICALLKKKGASMTSVADAAEVSVQSVRRVIRGESKSRRIASVIAMFLGKRLDDLWPGQYPDRYTRKAPEQVNRELRAAVLSVDAQRAA